MNLYLKIFLQLSVRAVPAFAVIFFAVFYYFVDIEMGFMAASVGIIVGIVFGISLSLISVTIHKISVQRFVDAGYENTDSVRQHTSIDLAVPYDQAFRLCVAALKGLSLGRILEDLPGGVIKVKTRLSSKSFGEIVELQITSLGDRETRVRVRSDPRVPWTSLDYGKNLDNVIRVEAAIRRGSEAQSS